MEVERQKFETIGIEKDGKIVGVAGEHAVGSIEKFEFGVPGDAITAIVGGSYTSHWNPDFLQRELGKNGTCGRFYFDKRVAVDVGDPEAKVNRRKRKLLFRHRFGYLCIPSGFPQDKKSVKSLYQAALDEYYQYEKVHPVPVPVEEMIIIDKTGNPRKALVSPTLIKVGGGILAGQEMQANQIQRAGKISSTELKHVKLQAKMHRKLRRSVQNGTPFRNPFVAPGRRLYPVQYTQ